MKLFAATLTLVTLATVATLAGCSDTGTDECEGLSPPSRGSVAVCPDGGVGLSDAQSAFDTQVSVDTLVPRLEDALTGYVASGVYVNLGTNRCAQQTVPSRGGGWDPVHDKCYAPADTSVTSGVCGTYACGTYAPGTVLVWDSVNPRFRYMLGEGVVCLPNDTAYTVSCP